MSTTLHAAASAVVRAYDTVGPGRYVSDDVRDAMAVLRYALAEAEKPQEPAPAPGAIHPLAIAYLKAIVHAFEHGYTADPAYVARPQERAWLKAACPLYATEPTPPPDLPALQLRAERAEARVAQADREREAGRAMRDAIYMLRVSLSDHNHMTLDANRRDLAKRAYEKGAEAMQAWDRAVSASTPEPARPSPTPPPPAPKQEPTWEEAWAKAASTIVQKGQTWRHLKRGTTYEIVGLSLFQDATGSGEHDMSIVVVYYSHARKSLCTRPLVEFADGRFELVSPAPEGRTLTGAGELMDLVDYLEELSASDALQDWHANACADAARILRGLAQHPLTPGKPELTATERWRESRKVDEEREAKFIARDERRLVAALAATIYAGDGDDANTHDAVAQAVNILERVDYVLDEDRERAAAEARGEGGKS